MRNLRITGRSLLRFQGEDPLPLTATTSDAASDALICAFGPSSSRAAIELKRLHPAGSESGERLDSIASWDAPCPLPSLPHDRILDLHYFADTATTCLVLAGGDIILVRESPLQNEDLVEIVGSIDAGISAAAWSPDEELLVIVTQADTLLLMTRDIENISNITLTPDDVNVSSHVSVGWGKKETQFKGKRARALQDPTVPERIDEGTLSPFEDHSVTVSWRGDGAYFAVNTVEQNRRRMIRVYSREGELDSVSEPVDRMEGALSWRPSGNLIASIRRLDDRVEVIFFERNGLRHGQFNLRLTPEELQSLARPLTLRWNNDSNVLAVSHPNKVQLWTMSNYHYYLKQELVAPEEATQTVMVNWHSERPLSLALATPESLQLLDYLSTTATGSVAPPYDYGAVASIDGKCLKLTPLRIANVPPPMAFKQLTLESAPVDVAISEYGNKIAVLSDSGLYVYGTDLTKRPVPMPSLLWHNHEFRGHEPRHVAFRGHETVYVVTDSWDEDHSLLWKSSHESLTCVAPVGENSPVASLVTSVDYQDVYLQFRDGSLYAVDSEESQQLTQLTFKAPSFAPDVKIVRVDGTEIAFTLTRSGALFANDRSLVRNCTSFLVTPSHLIYTTTQHLLKFVHLTSVDQLELPADEPQEDERCRSIERGAKLVTAMPTTYSVVLQMPRGNLETIYPRALVLAAIRRSIEADRYGEAFLVCRSQRVDMNILHDHDPERFMAKIAEVVNQIKRVDHIDLLLSQLRNEDVSETMYKETLKTKDQEVKAKQSPSDIESKVNRICDAFLAVLEKPEYREAHMQNIITSHVCKTPPDLEAGLAMIGKLQKSQDPLTDKAAEHICFLADVNQLYDTALGIYNLELALLIAQQSQKDPREYLPHLQSLHDAPPLRRKFLIDDQLGRRTKALQHLKDLDAFDELQEYTQKHNLYSEALELYQYDHPRLQTLTRLYADHLSATNKHADAAIAYESLDDHASAWPHYRSAHLWREALSSASLAGESADAIKSLALSLAEDLTESKDYTSASHIHLHHLSDLPNALKLLARATHFSPAIHLATLHSQPALIRDVINPALIERAAEFSEFLADMKTQLQAQIPRLLELRAKKEQDPGSYYTGVHESGAGNAGGIAGDRDIPDNISVAATETTSAGTFMTRYTNRSNSTLNTTTTRRTSKKRRQEERKRARGKKGTVYEEEYLVGSVERLVERVNGIVEKGGEAERLVQALVRRGMRERARACQRGVEEVVGMCREAVRVVFEGDESKEEEGKKKLEEEEEERHTGGDATFWASVEEVNRKKVAPVVKGFEGLSLLG
ncbi:elongator complex protein 1 [Sporormia fimetaria CBS 119925]|uniref:Elongator complex protein 1 n=1 Tax=Sporormia fimetaria CBS 119925 TaxID=1340428 RepID=A0A6A6UW17_9PLEO|nr:elongator complex protein 1 [Sporormia fimetaria CBS 119925]